MYVHDFVIPKEKLKYYQIEDLGEIIYEKKLI